MPCRLATPLCQGKEPEQKLRLFRLVVGWVKGLEPSTPGTTIRCSNQLSYPHHITDVVRLKGLEPPAHCLEGSCSIHLSYRRVSRPRPNRDPERRGRFGKEPRGMSELAATLERVMGIEPTRPAWKAGILPLNYTRMDGVVSHQPLNTTIFFSGCQWVSANFQRHFFR